MSADQPGSLAAALAALQADLPFVPKDAAAQYGKYADLATLTRIIMPRLAELGLSFTACPTMVNDKVGLDYHLRHVSGESVGGLYPLPSSGTPQAIGSAITYARRYCLCAVTGVAPDEDDDDGQAAEAEARELSRRPPETRPDGSATFAEQERMLHDQVGWEHVTPDSSVPPRTDWDVDPPTQPDPLLGAIRAMFALYRELEVTEKEDMLDNINAVLDRPADNLVTSRKDMSLEEITAVNGVLRKRRDAKRAAESVTT